MIAPFDEDGYLPPGIHSATWQEICARFGTNNHRKELLIGLKSGVDSLKAAGCTAIYLDGSFVTSKQHPNDFDVCWDPTGVDIQRLDPVLLDLSSGRKRQKMKFLGEFLPDTQSSSFLLFFQGDRDGTKKGIVKIELGNLP